MEKIKTEEEEFYKKIHKINRSIRENTLCMSKRDLENYLGKERKDVEPHVSREEWDWLVKEAEDKRKGKFSLLNERHKTEKPRKNTVKTTKQTENSKM